MTVIALILVVLGVSLIVRVIVGRHLRRLGSIYEPIELPARNGAVGNTRNASPRGSTVRC